MIDYYRLDLKIHFWRTTNGLEVDFVLYGEAGFYAFEIKSSAYIERKDLRALKNFQEDYPMAKCFLIFSGERAEKHENILVLPLGEALFRLKELLES